ncbi:MAG: hypothetical protein V3R25_10140 [Nitrosomonadaceae bacterium]
MATKRQIYLEQHHQISEATLGLLSVLLGDGEIEQAKEALATGITNIDALEACSQSTAVAVAKPKKASKRFVKPIESEVATYMHGKGSLRCLDDAEDFMLHYESNGWKVGKTAMKCWKSTATKWVKRAKSGVFAAPEKPGMLGAGGVDDLIAAERQKVAENNEMLEFIKSSRPAIEHAQHG